MKSLDRQFSRRADPARLALCRRRPVPFGARRIRSLAGGFSGTRRGSGDGTAPAAWHRERSAPRLAEARAPSRQPGPDRRWRVAMAASLVVALDDAGFGLLLPRRAANRPPAAPRTVAQPHRDRPHRAPERRARRCRLARSRGRTVRRTRQPGDRARRGRADLRRRQLSSSNARAAAAPSTPQYPEYEMDLVKRRGARSPGVRRGRSPVARSQLSFSLRDPGNLDAGDYDLHRARALPRPRGSGRAILVARHRAVVSRRAEL